MAKTVKATQEEAVSESPTSMPEAETSKQQIVSQQRVATKQHRSAKNIPNGLIDEIEEFIEKLPKNYDID